MLADKSLRASIIVVFLFLFIVSYTELSAQDNATVSSRPWTSRDAYVSASLGDARVLVPFLADDTSSAAICGLVYNGLTKVDKDLNVIGDLAEKWDIEEGGLSITFYLRKGVKWHDGMPFTAEDVKFTFETILDPKVGCPYVSAYTDIKEIKVIDDHTIRFLYKEPYAPALLKLGMGVVPKHLFEGVKDIRKSSSSKAPVGTGPYKFSKWEQGQYIVLEAYPDYFEHAPGIKYFVSEIIPDQSVQFLELVSGGIDYMDLNPYQFKYRASTPEFEERINKYEYLSPSYTYIGYNLQDPVLKDRAVREALSLAINKKEIMDSVLLGLGEAATGPFRKGTAYYDETVPDHEYDPGKARRILKEAGWSDTDGDGVLERDGKKFSIKLVTNQGNQTREDVATIVQREWSKIGIKTDIQVVAWAALLDQFIDKKNFQAVILGWVLPVDPDCYSVWHSASAGQGGLNFVSYSNKRVDDLIIKGRREFDPEERVKIYHEIHRQIAYDIPYTFLFFSDATPAVSKRFNGIKPAPAGIGYNFIDWYVDEREVKYKF